MRAAILAVLLAGCLPVPSPAPVPGAGCVEACRTVERLQCGGMGTGDCATACADLEATGFVPLHTECVAGAQTCAQVDACAEAP